MPFPVNHDEIFSVTQSEVCEPARSETCASKASAAHQGAHECLLGTILRSACRRLCFRANFCYNWNSFTNRHPVMYLEWALNPLTPTTCDWRVGHLLWNSTQTPSKPIVLFVIFASWPLIVACFSPHPITWMHFLAELHGMLDKKE